MSNHKKKSYIIIKYNNKNQWMMNKTHKDIIIIKKVTNDLKVWVWVKTSTFLSDPWKLKSASSDVCVDVRWNSSDWFDWFPPRPSSAFYFITLALFWQDAEWLCPRGDAHGNIMRAWSVQLQRRSISRQKWMNSSADRTEQSTISFMPLWGRIPQVYGQVQTAHV